MKKIIILILISIVNSFSQDIIIKNDKTEIKAKIEELTETTIKYKKFDMLDGPTYNINKREVFMMIYKNGSKEYMDVNTSQPTMSSVQQQNNSNSNFDRPLNQTNSNPTFNSSNQKLNAQTIQAENYLEIKGNRYFYKGEKIKSWKALKGVFEENRVQESVDLMNKRATQWGISVGCLGVSTILFALNGGFSSSRVGNPSLGLASTGVMIVGGVFALISSNQPKKAVKYYNERFEKSNRVSFKPSYKSDQLGKHVGISIGF